MAAAQCSSPKACSLAKDETPSSRTPRWKPKCCGRSALATPSGSRAGSGATAFTDYIQDQLNWLPRGLWRDSQEFGTRGHVDIVAAFPSPGRVLLHEQRHPAHPDYALTRELRELLAEARDVDGNPLEVISLPAPHILEDSEGWVDYSYVNHLVCNGAVISCAFDDLADAEAREVLAAAYPGREISRWMRGRSTRAVAASTASRSSSQPSASDWP